MPTTHEKHSFHQQASTFSAHQALKNLASLHKQTKSPDNSNMMYMFTKNTYNDFKTA